MYDKQTLVSSLERTTGRRATLAAAGAAAAGLLLAGRARAVNPPLTFKDIPGTGDIKVLNYALALEQLEADLYHQALLRLTKGGFNALSFRIPGLHLSEDQDDVFFTREFGKVEKQHRDFLTKALGNQAIKPFFYDFGMQKLTRKQVVELLYTAEKTGVGAYLGAIPFFATKTYLQTAGAIQGTEARHTAVFAQVLDQEFAEGLPVAPLANDHNGIDQPITPDTVLAAVSPFIVLKAPKAGG
jgi:hypothetical protein